MEKVETVSPEKKREAVMRFMVLWKVRYKVWPAIGERGQKRFNLAEERQVSSYSLLYTTTYLCVLSPTGPTDDWLLPPDQSSWLGW